jgi:hypothetical protein
MKQKPIAFSAVGFFRLVAILCARFMIRWNPSEIGDLVSQHGTKLRMGYEYDFGDGWQHAVVLENVTESEPGAKYPCCIAGERDCPPKDVGGEYGFADYVAAITNPNHSEHDELLEWDGPFDPAQFDAAKTTRRMKKVLPTW